MERTCSLLLAVVIVTIVSSCMFIGSTNARSINSAPKLEYKVQRVAHRPGEAMETIMEKAMNEMAATEWEFVQAVAYTDAKGPHQFMMTFKRMNSGNPPVPKQ